MTNQVEQLQAALEDESVPRFYFNGFTATVGSADIVIMLKHHEKPILLLSTSHVMGKTLLEKLGVLIAGFEDAVEQTIMSTDEVNERIRAKEENDNNGTH